MRVSSAGGFLGYLESEGGEGGWLAQRATATAVAVKAAVRPAVGVGKRCWIRGGSKVKGGGEGRPGEEGWRPVRC